MQKALIDFNYQEDVRNRCLASKFQAEKKTIEKGKSMQEYQVLARKYRPKKFSEVVGQEAVVATLKNAIRMKRVAHAYLFCGCRGTGKTTLARLFSKALNCAFLSSEEEPCNECSSCKEIALGHAMDVLEIDGASHRGIEDIRQINETIGFIPASGRYKIYLIDEVHMLTKEAFNALLKTLEEPPPHAKFFFATTEPHKIPPTILSRCQRFNLGRILPEKIVEKLLSIAQDLNLEAERDALFLLSELSEGSLRDAESLFDQVIAFQKEKITLETVSAALGVPSRDIFFSLDKAGGEKNFLAAFEIADSLFSSGKNVSYFLEELLSHFRKLFLLKQRGTFHTYDIERYKKSEVLYRNEQLLEILDLVMEAQTSLKFAPSEKAALEMLFLKILRTHQKITLENLIERLEGMEKRLSISENPQPLPHEFPNQKVKIKSPPSEPPKSSPPKRESEAKNESPLPKPKEEIEKKEPGQKPTIREQSRFDTLMHFTAKELNGSLKKEY